MRSTTIIVLIFLLCLLGAVIAVQRFLKDSNSGANPLTDMKVPEVPAAFKNLLPPIQENKPMDAGHALLPSGSAGPKGSLTVESEPWAFVLVDGMRLGTTPLKQVLLRPGLHAVILSNPEIGAELRFQVTIESGKETSVSKKLIEKNENQ